MIKIDNQERISQLKEEYEKLFGVKKSTFERMLEILEKQHRIEHTKVGKTPKLSALDKLIIMFHYYCERPTLNDIAADYGISKSTVSEHIQWVEMTLLKSGKFRLPPNRRINSDMSIVEIDNESSKSF